MEPVPPRRAFFRALVGADRAPAPAERGVPALVTQPVATAAQRRNRPPAGIPSVRA